MKKSVIIVGAGISGLTAGCYAQMNGYQASIFEMHNIPGGLCTAWKRKGYTFDISMHMLTGSVSGPFHAMWNELGVTEKFKFHYHKQMSLIKGMGKKLLFTTDKEALQKEMLAVSPEDEKLIKEFIKLIFGPDMMKAASLNPAKLRTFFEKIKVIPAILPLMGVFMKYGKMTLQQFALQFKDPFLREAVRFLIDSPGWPMLEFPMVALAGFINSGVSKAGVPLGGSMKVMLHLADLYKKLGGEMHYNSRVSNLIIENNKVVGIRLEDGQEFHADYVIWAGDGHTLIFDILGGKYINDKIRDMYYTWTPVRPVIHVMIGVNRDMSEEPHRIIFQPDEPITIAGEEHNWLTVLHHCFDKTMAPEGKSAVEVWYDTDYEYWEVISKHREEYEAEKQRIADYTIAQLEKRWPGFEDQVEIVDVPTPATYNRYTANWKGSPDGWYITADNMRENQPVRNLPGLQGLFMVGQWTAPFTGTIIAAMSGRQTVQLICKSEGVKFTVPSV